MIVSNILMANIDKSNLINDNKEQRSNKNSTKIVIITSVDNDSDRLLSYLNPSNVETIVVDLNDTNLLDAYQIHTKRSLSQSVRFYLKEKKILRN